MQNYENLLSWKNKNLHVNDFQLLLLVALIVIGEEIGLNLSSF